MVNTWSLQEYNTIFDDYSMKGLQVIQSLQNRSKTTVQKKAAMLGQEAPRPLSTTEKEFLDAHGNTLKAATVFFLAGRSPKEVASLVATS